MAFALDGLRMELIARDMNRMIEDLYAIDATVEFSSVVDSVAMRVASGALRRTRAAKLASITRSHASQTFTTLDGKLYKLSNFFKNDALWTRIQNHRAARLQQKLAARGLAKQSWWHAARKIRTSSSSAFLPAAEAPAYVMAANHLGEQYPQDVRTFTSGSATGFQRTVVNESPLGPGAGMEPALFFAMQGETRYYARLCAQRFYLTAAGRTARYPGIFTRPVAFSAELPVGIG